MKLLFCLDCMDVFKLNLNKIRSCECGKVAGQYLDNLNAEYIGDRGVPLGINNNSLRPALQLWMKDKNHSRNDFGAFVIPESAETFKKVTELTKHE